jgi:hypothetical protein
VLAISARQLALFFNGLLVVIARAVVMELSDWWTSEYCEHDAARVFMEAFCSFAGIRPAPLQYAEAQ